MADKKLTFQAVLDTADFDRKIAAIMQKVQTLAKQAPQMASQNVTEQMQKQGVGVGQVNNQQKDTTIRNLNDIQKVLEKYRKVETSINDVLAERIKLLDKIRKAGQQEQGIISDQQRVLTPQGQAASQAPQGTPNQSGIYQQNTSNRRDARESLRPFTSMLTGVASAINIAGSLAGGAISLGAESDIDKARAMQGSATYGRDIYSGKLSKNIFFEQERLKAGERAKEQMEAYNVRERAIATGIPFSVGAAALGGAAAGSVVPGLGTMAGGIAAGVGTAYAMTSKERLLRWGSMLGSDTAKNALQSSLQAKQAEFYQQQLKAQEEQQPLKQMALERFDQVKDRDLAAQRQLGLNDKEYRYNPSSLLNLGSSEGFTEQQTLNAAMQFQQRGQSASTTRLATFANQAARSNNITNAASILGNISGTGTNIVDSKEAFIKIFSEAQRIGYDSSKHAQEMRKFGENVSEVVYKLGITGPEGVANVAQQQAAFTVGQSSRETEAGKTAADVLSQKGVSDSWVQVRRRQSLNKRFKGISAEDLELASSLREEQISEENDVIKGLAEKYKTTPKLAAEGMRKDYLKSEVKPGMEKAQNKMAELMTQAGGDIEKAKKLPGYYTAQLEAMGSRSLFGMESGAAGTPEAIAGVVGRARQQAGYLGGEETPKGLLPAKEFDITKQSEKIGDLANAQEAKQQGVVNKQIEQMSTQLADSFTKVINASKESLEKFMTVQEKVKEGGNVADEAAKAYDSLNDKLGQTVNIINNLGNGLPGSPVSNRAPTPMSVRPPK